MSIICILCKQYAYFFRQVNQMVEFITGQAGSGKTTLMFSKIKESSGKQCIIVPEQFSYDFDKKLYYYLGAERFNELMSSSFTGLSRQIFQLFGDPSRNGEYADDLAKMILIYQAVSEAKKRPDGINFFRTDHNGFAEDILNIINDMKSAGISPEELYEKSKIFDDRLMYKAGDIASIYLEYQRLMLEYGFKDNLENTREAAKIANHRNFFKGQNVYIDEFDSFSADQLQMIDAVVSSAENVCITLKTDDINAGDFTLFELVNKTYRKIAEICRSHNKEYRIINCTKNYRFANPELEYVSTHILRNFRYEPEKAPEPKNLHVFEARDMYSEAEYVCASIKHLIHEDKTLKYRNIAIVSNDITGYAGVLRAAFERYDIPYFMSFEKSVSHTAIMVYFTSLLDLLNNKKIRSETIFRMLKSGMTDISLTEISLLENYCYKWGVDGEMWTSSFDAPDLILDRLESLRASVIEPVIRLRKKLSRKSTAEKICTYLYDFIVENKVERNVSRIMNELIRCSRDYEAAELKRLWGCLIDILDSIYDTLGGKEISFAEIARIIKSMIGRINYSVPPQTLDAVMTASARTARLNAPRIVFVMGANDGDFPNQVTVHGLFSEPDRKKLAENKIQLSTPIEDLIASERLVVYKVLSSASEKMYISYPLSDLSGQSKYPAQPVDSIIKMFGEKVRMTESDIPLHYYAVTLHSAFYHYMQNISVNTVSAATVREVLMNRPEYKRRIKYILSRSEYQQEYCIDKDIMSELQNFEPLRLSPTGFEEYNKCHFKYFCDYCLKLQICEKVELDARVAGDITHECFYSILAKRSKEDFLKMTYEELKSEVNEQAEAYRHDKLAGDYGKDAKFALFFNKFTDRLSEVFLHTQQSLMVSDFVPHRFELDLRDTHSVVLPFADGKKLSFGGVVDRADICCINGRKYVRIVDYKSSRKEITAETLSSGINMQMMLYLFATTDKGGFYEGYEPAGVLYSPFSINDISLDAHKIDELNISAIDSSLKTSALVLSDMEVLEAMENGVQGRYIPVELDKNGEIKAKSECITRAGMNEIKKLTYKNLTEMAESLYSGDAEAVPLLLDGRLPCNYCLYVNICDNSLLERFREPDPEKLTEAEVLLNMKTEEKEDE